MPVMRPPPISINSSLRARQCIKRKSASILSSAIRLDIVSAFASWWNESDRSCAWPTTQTAAVCFALDFRAPPLVCAKGAPVARPLPDKGAIDPDALKAEPFIERHRARIEIVDEEGDRLSFPEKMPANLAQHGVREAASAELRICPDAHQLNDVI